MDPSRQWTSLAMALVCGTAQLNRLGGAGRGGAALIFERHGSARALRNHLSRPEATFSWTKLIAAEPVTDVDTTAADMLTELDEALNAQGISLVFAELKDPVRAKIERYGLTRTIDPHHFFPTITAATAAFRDETGTQWVAEPQAVDGQATQGQPPADSGLAPAPDIPAAPPAG